MHTCAYTISVEVEWDGRKAEANHRKHGVRFVAAVAVLYDEHAVTIVDHRAVETRYVKVGADTSGRILVIVYSLRGSLHRLISARRATRRERRRYCEGK